MILSLIHIYGTLDEACFKGYIVEDSLYLREYAKVFAWGMTKARTMETLRNYYSLLGFVQELSLIHI